MCAHPSEVVNMIAHLPGYCELPPTVAFAVACLVAIRKAPMALFAELAFQLSAQFCSSCVKPGAVLAVVSVVLDPLFLAPDAKAEANATTAMPAAMTAIRPCFGMLFQRFSGLSGIPHPGQPGSGGPGGPGGRGGMPGGLLSSMSAF
jgi:hypothetical protein